jgi:hypothetical protein
MPDIFLSYAREDQARAAQVADGLKRDGYDVFWDKEIPPGRSWADYLEEKLSVCKVVVVLWSRASTASEWVREEARIAKDKGKLIPAMIDAATPPFGFGEVQAANLTGWTGALDHPEWRRLTGAVQTVLGEGPRPRVKTATTASGLGWQGAAGATTESPPPAKKGNWLSWVGGGFLVFMGLGVLGAVMTPSVTKDPAKPNDDEVFGPLQPGVSQAAASAAEQARANDAAASGAAQAATANSQQGQQAAQMAAQGTPGFSVQPSPQGTVAGNLAQLASGQPTPVGLQMANGMQFTGLMHVSTAGATMDGVFMLAQMSVAGKMTWAPTGAMEFIGAAQNPGRYQITTRETGQQGAAEARGVGVIRYPDGKRYEGEYRNVGEGLQAQIFRNGLGVLYSANGDVQEAGRFDNDRLIGPE